MKNIVKNVVNNLMFLRIIVGLFWAALALPFVYSTWYMVANPDKLTDPSNVETFGQVLAVMGFAATMSVIVIAAVWFAINLCVSFVSHYEKIRMRESIKVERARDYVAREVRTKSGLS